MIAYSYKLSLDKERLPVLVRETAFYKVDRRYRFDNPCRIDDLARDIGLQDMAEEYVYCVCLDARMRVTGLFEVSHGTVTNSVFSPREIFQKALMLGAVSIVMIHNHPSGDATPSSEDMAATKAVMEAGKILGIQLADHVIVADRTYYSMKEQGVLPE